MKQPARSRGGRPRTRQIQPGDRVQLGLRVTPSLKQQIDRYAFDNGRSVSQECEHRLEVAFQFENLLPDTLRLAYGAQLAAILQMMGNAMKETLKYAAKGSMDDRTWAESPYVFDQVRSAVAEVLTACQPRGEIVPPAPKDIALKDFATLFGPIAARRTMQDVVDPPEIDFEAQRTSSELKPALGPLVTRIETHLNRGRKK